MKTSSLIGLGNALNDQTEILHTSVYGSNTIGRTTDLVVAWCERTKNVDASKIASLRILAQALLEYASAGQKDSSIYFECAIENSVFYTSVRHDNRITSPSENAEKTLTQYWLNSDQTSMLKKNLGPHDQVEVRFNGNMQMIEWRVSKPLNAAELAANQVGFKIIMDSSEAIVSEGKNYTDLGDLPYEDWLKEVYKKSKSSEKGWGETVAPVEEEPFAKRVTGKQVQQDSEKIVVSSQTQNKGEAEDEDDDSVSYSRTKEEDDRIRMTSQDFLKDSLTQLKSENQEIREKAEKAIRASKQTTMEATMEISFLTKKVKRLQLTSKRKDQEIKEHQDEIKTWKERYAKLQEKYSSEAPKQVQKKETAQIKANNENEGLLVANNLQIEELTKKLDRTMRALEAEKEKVKSLSERVIVAEKEAQGKGPQIEGLEQKIEHTLKMVQQHKKETETVK